MTIPPRLTRQGGKVPAITVDDEFASHVNKHIWYWTGRYFYSCIGEEFVNNKGFKARRPISLHKFVWLLAGNSMAVELDHINRDSTDNRLCNLRVADRKLNGMNRAFKEKKNGLPQGVLKGGSQTFRSRIRIGKKSFHIGTYRSSEEASAAYQEMQSLIIRYREGKLKEESDGL